MKEFVVGLDGSEHSRMALRWAAAAAQAAQVPVRAVQAWSLAHNDAFGRFYPQSAGMASDTQPPPAEQMDELIRQDTAATVADVLGTSVEVETNALRGPPAGALQQTVAPDSVLVVGSRGRGGFAGLLLGSVSQECVEYATCPVVVVRTSRALADGEMILVGEDPSPGAQRALEWAHALANATRAQLGTVHAWRATASGRPPAHGQRLQARATHAVAGWAEQVDDEIESHEVEGDPRDVLVKAAERFDPALTVVGRRGAGGLRSMRLGSTANHLVRHAPSSVAVVPTPDDHPPP